MLCKRCNGRKTVEIWIYPATDNFGDSDGAKPQYLGRETCKECGGTGDVSSSGLVTCPVCRGSKEVCLWKLLVNYRPDICWHHFECPVCDGRGEIAEADRNRMDIEDGERKLRELKILLIKLLT